MKKYRLEEIDLDNTLFHFTENKNLSTIESYGLNSNIGENAKNLEKDPKIFFSKGLKGIYMVSDVWIKWLSNRIYGESDKIGIYAHKSNNEKNQEQYKWIKQFITGQYKNDPEKIPVIFDYYYNYLRERSYLILDIEDGREYKKDDIDITKQEIIESKENKATRFLMAKEMYGPYSNINSPIVDQWNMHTLPNINISKDKISQLVTSDGKEDYLSILLEIHDKYRKNYEKQYFIDDFIEYAKKRRKANNSEVSKILNSEESVIKESSVKR